MSIFKNYFTRDLIYEQSAVIPYRIHDGEVEILLITSRKRKRWIIPKGLIEPDLTPTESAAKEALEEAGVEGIIEEKEIGEYRYKKWGGTCEVKVYLMKVTKVHEDWEESYFRTRKWVSIKDALDLISEEALQKIIGKVPKMIKKSE